MSDLSSNERRESARIYAEGNEVIIQMRDQYIRLSLETAIMLAGKLIEAMKEAADD